MQIHLSIPRFENLDKVADKRYSLGVYRVVYVNAKFFQVLSFRCNLSDCLSILLECSAVVLFSIGRCLTCTKAAAKYYCASANMT